MRVVMFLGESQLLGQVKLVPETRMPEDVKIAVTKALEDHAKTDENCVGGIRGAGITKLQ